MSTSQLPAPAGPINPDETPEAAYPSPSLVTYMRIVENDAADDYDGGRILFKPVRAGIHEDILDAFFTISAKRDAFLVQYPWKTREAKQGRFFKVTVEEVAADALPPDPTPPTPQDVISQLQAENTRLAAELAAATAAAPAPATTDPAPAPTA